ncbi:MAG: hypothetical protein U0941_30620 [Planctomycetaceae bacterium]
MKKCVAAWLSIFVVWCILDFIGHGLILSSLYAALPGVWRPQAEIKIGFVYAGVALTSAMFVAIYFLQVKTRGLISGLLYGLLFGIGTGASIACGGYAVHPIQIQLALGWYIITLVECSIGGVIVGTVLNEPPARKEK